MRRRIGIPSGRGGRIILALIVAAISIAGYFLGTSEEYNPFTGEEQRVSMTKEQEVVLGLQAAPEMAAQYGGLHPNEEAQALVDEIGQRLVDRTEVGDGEYEYEFHLLADERTVNAFALPGGQIFITAGLLNELNTRGELAGILAHEIGHVVGRHAAEQIAKSQLMQGLTSAAVIAAYDPDDPSTQQHAQVAALIGQVVTMKFGRDHELESDRLGVQIMGEAGYDPRALISVMEILAQATEGQRPPEFFSTHPNPDNRIEEIREAIRAEYPNGVPEGLIE